MCVCLARRWRQRSIYAAVGTGEPAGWGRFTTWFCDGYCTTKNNTGECSQSCCAGTWGWTHCSTHSHTPAGHRTGRVFRGVVENSLAKPHNIGAQKKVARVCRDKERHGTRPNWPMTANNWLEISKWFSSRVFGWRRHEHTHTNCVWGGNNNEIIWKDKHKHHVKSRETLCYWWWCWWLRALTMMMIETCDSAELSALAPSAGYECATYKRSDSNGF